MNIAKDERRAIVLREFPAELRGAGFAFAEGRATLAAVLGAMTD